MEPVYIALGYFDSAHIGHKAIIQKTAELAKENKAVPTVLTFANGFQNFLGRTDGEVFTLFERALKYFDYGAEDVFVYPTDNLHMNLGKLGFFNYLNRHLKIKGYICGQDFTYGKDALGDVNYIKEYAAEHKQEVIVMKLIKADGKKVSTTRIKKLLSDGKMENANVLLGSSYFVSGKVVEGRKVGRLLGFPTINIEVPTEKFKIYNAVYAGHITVGETTYKAIINYGAKPTFNVTATQIEAHIIDYNGDLYGKEVTLYFDKYLREIQKFADKEGLITQLKADIEAVK